MAKQGIFISIRESSHTVYDNIQVLISIPKTRFRDTQKPALVQEINENFRDFMLNNKDGKTSKTYWGVKVYEIQPFKLYET